MNLEAFLCKMDWRLEHSQIGIHTQLIVWYTWGCKWKTWSEQLVAAMHFIFSWRISMEYTCKWFTPLWWKDACKHVHKWIAISGAREFTTYSSSESLPSMKWQLYSLEASYFSENACKRMVYYGSLQTSCPCISLIHALLTYCQYSLHTISASFTTPLFCQPYSTFALEKLNVSWLSKCIHRIAFGCNTVQVM